MTRFGDFKPGWIAGAGLLAALILAVDLSLPLGVAGGVPYVALVCLGWYCRGPRHIVALGVVASLLTIVGYLYSPDGGIAWVVLTNRALALFAIWLTVTFLIIAKRTGELEDANGTLQGEIAERERAEAALRESDARLRAIMDHAPMEIYLKDVNGRYVEINRRYEELWDVKNEEVRGKLPGAIHKEEAFAQASMAHDLAVLESGQVIEQEDEAHLDDGAHILHMTKFPIRDAAGQIAGLGAIAVDVTERKRAEEALQNSERAAHERIIEMKQAQTLLEHQGADLIRIAGDLRIARDQAEDANRAKSEFLAAMSHELRTPLNAVIGFSEIMKHEALGPIGSVKYRDYAADIHSSGRHLLDLINDILDLSKIESGLDELHEENIEVPKTFQSVLVLVQQRADIRRVEIDRDVGSDLPLLQADKRKLKQILVNLLTNAIKFTEPGGKVTFKAWCRADSGFVFQVADTGIGMAPEDIPKALSRFSQIDSDLNRKHEGTGLGLPLTKSLVELHGGSLDLQSQLGVGTTVTVRFPVTRIVHIQGGTHPFKFADKVAS